MKTFASVIIGLLLAFFVASFTVGLVPFHLGSIGRLLEIVLGLVLFFRFFGSFNTFVHRNF